MLSIRTQSTDRHNVYLDSAVFQLVRETWPKLSTPAFGAWRTDFWHIGRCSPSVLSIKQNGQIVCLTVLLCGLSAIKVWCVSLGVEASPLRVKHTTANKFFCSFLHNIWGYAVGWICSSSYCIVPWKQPREANMQNNGPVRSLSLLAASQRWESIEAIVKDKLTIVYAWPHIV